MSISGSYLRRRRRRRRKKAFPVGLRSAGDRVRSLHACAICGVKNASEIMLADGVDDQHLTGEDGDVALRYMAAPCCAATRADIIAPGWFTPCTTKAIASQV